MKQSTKSTKPNPETGDESQIWIVTLLMASLGLLMFKNKKSSNK